MLLKADQQLAWGEWVELDTLPPQTVLLVCGEAVPAASTPLSVR
jgi:hypothetical protein